MLIFIHVVEVLNAFRSYRGGGRYEKLVVVFKMDTTKNVSVAKECTLLIKLQKVGAIEPPAPPVQPLLIFYIRCLRQHLS